VGKRTFFGGSFCFGEKEKGFEPPENGFEGFFLG